MNFKLYSDSTYTFTIHEQSPNYEKTEKFDGFCRLTNDTIYFTPFQFKPVNSQKAVLKNNFIEFVEAKFPLKLKIRKPIMPSVSDSLASKSYALFMYDSKHYNYFPQSVKPYDLTQQELAEVDRQLRNYFERNKAKLEKPIDSYCKQVTAVLNVSQEKEVYIACHCKGRDTNKDFEYEMMIHFRDGGSCHLGVKVNLTKHTYSEVFVNGDA
ncbi:MULTISPECIES: hypothetical protein [unclassified Spirosoma]|mgnify:CR=1 FL=1|uniref:hypothetical protein n=1 Tax=unclassified Spirosoma TaxID=2621999 RepID=UPI00095E3257|nr:MULTISPECIES: hypothetical protein [unclassified Spirosoma]MBN8820841.1 hypothetical protein [Spirosoma sp.]OJW75762.1 MAG: hypothetical protein BGO59_04555 [Spirosoma sp. 48-14]